jgi:nucleotide-binding universal stress UspA family protein
MNQNFRKILVPVDFSPSSGVAIRHALDFARAFGGTVVVLHAWEVPVYLRPDLTVWAGEVSATLAEQVRVGAEHAMRDFARENGFYGNELVTCRIVQAPPYHAILTAAEEGQFDLIVMGTHGRTGLSHVLLGSVAEKVVRHARCPVLTVRAPGTLSHSHPAQAT